MATQVGSLYTSLTLDSSAFLSNMKRAASATEENGRKIERGLTLAKSAAVAFAGSLVIGELIGAAKSAVDYASSLGETAQQVGFTTKSLQELRYAASQQGVEQDQLDTGLARLTKTLGQAKDGSKGAVAAFDAIGVSQAELIDLTPDEAFRRVAEAIGKIPDPARRAALEVQFFGKAGQKLDTLLAGGVKGIDEMRRAANELGLVISDDRLAKLDDLADKGAALKTVYSANLASLIGDNADAILRFGEAVLGADGYLVGFIKDSRAVAELYGRGGVAGIIAGVGSEKPGASIGDRYGTAAATVKTDEATVARLQKEYAAAKTSIVGRFTGTADLTKQLLDKATANLANSRAALLTERYSPSFFEGGKRAAAPVAELPEIVVTGRRKGAKGTAAAKDFSVEQFLGLDNRRDDPIPALEGIDLQIEHLREKGKTIGESLRDGYKIDDLKPLIDGLDLVDHKFDDLIDAGNRFADDLSRGLGDAIVNGDDLGDVLVGSIKRAAAALISSELLKLLDSTDGGSGGGFGAFIGSLLSGKREAGGPVTAGAAYLVGEKRPEIFVPGTSGTILPRADGLGGGGRQRVDVRVTTAPSPFFISTVQTAATEAAQSAAGAAVARSQRPRASSALGMGR